MRDPAELYTKRGTPILILGSRVALVVIALITIGLMAFNTFPDSELTVVWLVYLVGIYVASEKVTSIFRQRGIDLAFAFPLLVAVFVLNLTSTVLNSQERLPLMNRAEHFAGFILITYVVWVFFLKYLPQAVWSNHPYYTAILVFSVTAAFGVCNEIIELAMDGLFKTRHIGGRFDTPLDLLMNTLGASTFLAVRLIVGDRLSSRR